MIHNIIKTNWNTNMMSNLCRENISRDTYGTGMYNRNCSMNKTNISHVTQYYKDKMEYKYEPRRHGISILDIMESRFSKISVK